MGRRAAASRVDPSPVDPIGRAPVRSLHAPHADRAERARRLGRRLALTYPAIEPHEHGRLDVGDGQSLYWEVCGNPSGKPALMLHGGPGSGCVPYMRSGFDPRRYRIVLFDQRGAGRSRPHSSEPGVDLSVNTTQHLVADIERLREHLVVDRWLVLGTSWGSTLALAYAERFPHRVSEIVLAAVTMTRPADVEWFSRGAGAFFPAEWERFRAGVAVPDRDGDLVAAYARLLVDPDPDVHHRAARDWCAWEEALVSLESGGRANPRYDDPAFRLGFARLVTHYFSHAAWLAEDELLTGADRLAGIPGVLIHGRLDIGAPVRSAWQLAQAWPDGELVVVGGAGHASAAIGDHAVAATDAFADR